MRSGQSQLIGKDVNKIVVSAVIGVAVIGGFVFVLNRPEPLPPTPKERLAQAAEEIQEVTQEAIEAASDATKDASDALANDAKEAVGEMTAEVAKAYDGIAERVALTSQDTQAQLAQMLTDWKATGIVTEDGIDFNAATAAVQASDLSTDAKANVVAIVNALRDAPGALEDKLSALNSFLKT